MSIFNYLFDNEWSQRSDIEELKARSSRQHQVAARSYSRTESKVRSLETEVDTLKDEVGALQLIVRSLVKTLETTPGWREEDFRENLMAIDLEDGILDGKAKLPSEK
jgi:hypothetical protein